MTSFFWVGGSHDMGASGSWLTLNPKGALSPTSLVPGAADTARILTPGTLTGSVDLATLIINAATSIDGTTNVSGATAIGVTATAAVLVSGGTWSDGGTLYVGQAKSASLTLQNAAQMSNSAPIFVGKQAGVIGTLDVMSGSTLNTTGSVDVLGEDALSAGSATIDGAGSVWNSGTETLLGDSGAGTLTVSNAASLASLAEMALGNASTGTGVLILTSGGRAAVAADLAAGIAGSGTITIDSGSSLTVGGTLVLDNGGGFGHGGTLQVSGASGVSAGFLLTGTAAALSFGAGSSLNVNGKLNPAGVDFQDAIALGGRLGLHGAMLTAAGQVMIGNSGAGAAITVDGGASAAVWNTVIGDTANFGGSLVLSGVGSKWTDGAPAGTAGTLPGTMVVGRGGNGTLEVLAGATLSEASFAVIAEGTGESGNATLDGAGSVWKVGAQLQIGAGGTGSVVVSNAASLTANEGIVAGFTSSGSLTVESGGVVTSKSVITSGANGSGQVLVNGGTLVDQGDLLVGGGMAGQLTIEGAGKVAVSGNMQSGAGAITGAVLVTGASSLSMKYLNADVASTFAAGSGSAITVTGTNTGGVNAYLDAVAMGGHATLDAAHLTSGGQITVGAGTADAAIVVRNGTTASVWATVLGATSNFGGTLIITGAGTKYTDVGGAVPGNTLDTGGYMVLGSGSAGASGSPTVSSGTLAVSAGATLTETRYVLIGGQTGANGVASVDGSASNWTAAGELRVGGGGSGTLTVSHGAHVSTATALNVATGSIGRLQVQTGGTLTSSGTLDTVASTINTSGTIGVDGAGSLYRDNGALVLGLGGDATLNASNSGSISIGGLLDAANGIGSTATINVTGTSIISAGSQVQLGDGGTATLNISGSGTLTAANGLEAGISGGSGTVNIGAGGLYASTSGNDVLAPGAGTTASVNLNGALARWTSNAQLQVGDGGDAQLSLSNGASLSAAGSLFAAVGGTGTLTINSGASVSVASADIASNGGVATVVVHGTFTSTGVADLMGDGAGSLANITIDGAGAQWTSGGRFRLGQGGAASLVISNNAFVHDGALGVGGPGGAGSVQISSGGTLLSDGNKPDNVGSFPGATGIASIDGSTSTWTNTGDFLVGVGGSGSVTVSGGSTQTDTGTLELGVGTGSSGSLRVLSGGQLNTNGTAASVFGGDGATASATIDGAGSLWRNAGGLLIGASASGTLAVTGGAGVMLGNGGTLDLGATTGATAGHGSVTIDGIGSSLNAAWASIGDSGSSALTISNGGSLALLGPVLNGTTDGWTYVAQNAGSGGSQLTVTGTGSQLQLLGGLGIGEAAGGELDVSQGGELLFATPVTPLTHDTLIVGDTGTGSGTLNVTGGTIDGGPLLVTIGSFGSGIVNLSSGGSLTAADGIDMALDSAASGTLNVDASTVHIAGVFALGGLGAVAGGAALVDATNGGAILADVGTVDLFASATLSVDATSSIDLGGSLNAVAGQILVETALVGAGRLAGLTNVSGSMFATGGTLNTDSIVLSGGTLQPLADGAIDLGGGLAPAATMVAVDSGFTLSGAGIVNANMIVAGQVTANTSLSLNGAVSLMPGSLISLGGSSCIEIGGVGQFASGGILIDQSAAVTGAGTLEGQVGLSGNLIGSGGTLNAAQVLIEGGQLSADATGAVEIGTTLGSGGPLAPPLGSVAVGIGGTLSGLGSVGVAVAVSGGLLQAVGGTLSIAASVTMTGGTLNAASDGALDIGGIGTLTAGSVMVDLGQTLSGVGSVSSPLEVTGQLLATGGTLDLGFPVTGAGTLAIAAGATLRLDSSESGAAIAFAGKSATLRLNVRTLPKAEISGFAGNDRVVIPGATGDVAGFNTIKGSTVLELFNSGTLVGSVNFAGAPKLAFDPATGTVTIACFASGTRIATRRGGVLVENLCVGDMVMLGRSKGSARPVQWLGHRAIDCRRHARPHDVWPVRVAPHAFGTNRPARELWLSPDHAVHTGGVLIPVRYLVNGGSITQVETNHIEYWHVELDQHDVLLAENLPCESYLDTGNRSAFASGAGAIQAHPDFARSVWAEGACAKLVLDGKPLARAKQRLIARLPRLGHCVTNDPAIRLLADGVELPAYWNGTACRAVLPAGAQCVTIESRTARPAELDPMSDDMRLLGAALVRLRLDGVECGLHDARLIAGWLPAEPTQRWTSGMAKIDVCGLHGVELKFGDWHRYLAPQDCRTGRCDRPCGEPARGAERRTG